MLLTVEGERDDICAVGQTVAAHDLCRKLRPYLKRHHMQAGVGHYGVFSGKRWENQVYPIGPARLIAASIRPRAGRACTRGLPTLCCGSGGGGADGAVR